MHDFINILFKRVLKQHGRVVRALYLWHSGLEFKSCSDCWLDLFSVVLSSNPWPRLEHGPLFCLQPVRRPKNSENKPRDLCFSKALFDGLIFGGAYIQRGLSIEGNLRFKINWASLMVGRNFTVFALFYFVFEGNFQVQAPGGLIFGGAI